jgi:hypothetical protein
VADSGNGTCSYRPDSSKCVERATADQSVNRTDFSLGRLFFLEDGSANPRLIMPNQRSNQP